MLLILGVVMVNLYNKTVVVELMLLILWRGMVIKIMYYLKDFFKQ